MDERDEKRSLNQIPGPVITISREHGCNAMSLANKIIDHMTEINGSSKTSWRCINKEILETAANDLNITSKKVANAMDTRHELLVQDIFSSFTHHYGVTNKNILDTLIDVVKSYCNEGKTIIVGRGGALIARDIEQSVHIKLQASYQWRVNQIQNKFNLDLTEAKSQCVEMDEKRIIWNKQLTKEGVTNSVYDLILNSEYLSDSEMLEMITVMLKRRKIIH